MKVMLECDKFSQEQKNQARALFLKYWPIEQDHTIHMDVKREKMLEWWVANLEDFTSKSLNLTNQDFERMVFSSRLAFRHGFSDLV